MKSKRAEKYIEEHRDKHPYPSGDFSAGAAFEAVELAEEEMAEAAAVLHALAEIRASTGSRLLPRMSVAWDRRSTTSSIQAWPAPRRFGQSSRPSSVRSTIAAAN